MDIIAPDRDRMSEFEFELAWQATHAALAYLFAFTLAALDHIARETGRRDYENYESVWPDDETAQEIWRAKTTSAQAREFAADADLMRRLRATSLLAVAEDYARHLLKEEIRP